MPEEIAWLESPQAVCTVSSDWPHEFRYAACDKGKVYVGGAGKSSLPKDFQRMWCCSTISRIESAACAGAVPSIAILVLQSSDLAVPLLVTISGIANVAVGLALGPFIEFHRKLPSMVLVNLFAFIALLTIPAASWFGVLSYCGQRSPMNLGRCIAKDLIAIGQRQPGQDGDLSLEIRSCGVCSLMRRSSAARS
jgi:hypothetical protein